MSKPMVWTHDTMNATREWYHGHMAVGSCLNLEYNSRLRLLYHTLSQTERGNTDIANKDECGFAIPEVYPAGTKIAVRRCFRMSAPLEMLVSSESLRPEWERRPYGFLSLRFFAVDNSRFRDIMEIHSEEYISRHQDADALTKGGARGRVWFEKSM